MATKQQAASKAERAKSPPFTLSIHFDFPCLAGCSLPYPLTSHKYIVCSVRLFVDIRFSLGSLLFEIITASPYLSVRSFSKHKYPLSALSLGLLQSIFRALSFCSAAAAVSYTALLPAFPLSFRVEGKLFPPDFCLIGPLIYTGFYEASEAPLRGMCVALYEAQ